MIQALEDNQSLAELSLESNFYQTTLCPHLIKALEVNTTLISLDLTGGHLGDVGAIGLAQLLERNLNSTLTRLKLEYTIIRDVGTMALAKALKTNSSLTSLDLTANSVAPGATIELFKSLQTNSTLTFLRCFRTHSHDASIQELATALKTNATLSSLSTGCDCFVDQLLPAMELNVSLVHFSPIQSSSNATKKTFDDFLDRNHWNRRQREISLLAFLLSFPSYLFSSQYLGQSAT